jgi:hypothetical protein
VNHGVFIEGITNPRLIIDYTQNHFSLYHSHPKTSFKMKATFFSLFALAASAIASPIAQPAGVNPTPQRLVVTGLSQRLIL